MQSSIWTALLLITFAQAQSIVTVCESYSYTATFTFTEYETFYVVDGRDGVRPITPLSLNTRSSIATTSIGRLTSDDISNGGIGNSRTTSPSTLQVSASGNVPGNGTLVVIPDNTIAPVLPIPRGLTTTPSVSKSRTISTTPRTSIKTSTRTSTKTSSKTSTKTTTKTSRRFSSRTSTKTSTKASTSIKTSSKPSTSNSVSARTSTSTIAQSKTSSSTTTKTTSISISSSPTTTSTTSKPSVSTTTVTITTDTTSTIKSTSSSSSTNPIISSTSSITSTIPIVTNKAYIDTILRHHNRHRFNHTSDPLTWNSTLAETAKKIANSCVYQHDTATDCPPGGPSCYGQNIAAGYLSTQMSFLVSDGFYNSEVNSYTYYGGEPTDGTLHEWGHFSQIVWKIDTLSVGCYTMDCSGRSGGLVFPGGGGANVRPVFTICNYGGPGNWVGEFKQNVIRSKGLPSIYAGYMCPTLDNCEDGVTL